MRVRARHQHHSGGRTISVGQWPAVISRPRAGEQLLKRGLPRAAVSAEPPHRGPLVVRQQPAWQPIQRVWESNSALSPGLGDESTTRALLEQAFHDHLGIEQTLWLHRGCAGDDTHGHIDDVTRFVAENTILTCVEPNTADENHLLLAENLDRLRSARNLRGKPFQIVQLPMPSPVDFAGQRLPASYANFYIANSLVLVPTFNDAQDRHALDIIASCFPTREVVGIHAVDLVWGLGTLHCLSQQEPA